MMDASNTLDPVFLTLDEILEIHDQQIERYGGSAGLRDGVLWNRPQPRRRPPLAASFCIRPYLRWPPHICSTFARIILSSMEISALALIPQSLFS
jgi:hypothetical protein